MYEEPKSGLAADVLEAIINPASEDKRPEIKYTQAITLRSPITLYCAAFRLVPTRKIFKPSVVRLIKKPTAIAMKIINTNGVGIPKKVPFPTRMNCSGSPDTDSPLVTPIAIPLKSVIVARVANEKNTNILGKSLVTLYGIMVTFFLLQVSSYLSMQQKGLSYSLSELKATGVKLSAGSEAAISRYQINLSDGYPTLAPELPNILFAAVVFLIIVGTTWLKNTFVKS